MAALGTEEAVETVSKIREAVRLPFQGAPLRRSRETGWRATICPRQGLSARCHSYDEAWGEPGLQLDTGEEVTYGRFAACLVTVPESGPGQFCLEKKRSLIETPSLVEITHLF